jgi:hypothetical protein
MIQPRCGRDEIPQSHTAETRRGLDAQSQVLAGLAVGPQKPAEKLINFIF